MLPCVGIPPHDGGLSLSGWFKRHHVSRLFIARIVVVCDQWVRGFITLPNAPNDVAPPKSAYGSRLVYGDLLHIEPDVMHGNPEHLPLQT